MTTFPVGATWTYSADRLSKFADSLMDKVIATFEMAGVALPDRRFITVGTVVHDCEELAISFGSVEKGMPGQGEEPQNCENPSTAQFTINLVRCFPVSQNPPAPPPAAELTKSADELMQDAWLLLHAIDELNRDPFTSLGGMIYSVSIGEPQGGLVGVVGNVQAMVP